MVDRIARASTFLFFIQGAQAGCPSVCTQLAVEPCASSMMAVVESYKCRMPLQGSEKYVHPSQEVMQDWEILVSQMLTGTCNPLNVPASLSSVGYQLGIVSDIASQTEYCVLVNYVDANNDGVVDAPWGIAAVNLNQDVKNLSLDIPHPLHDGTWEQGINVFLGINARSYTMSGSHRYANAALACQTDYQIADAAHTLNTFHASSRAIFQFYNNLNVDHASIQLHGMASTSCTDDAYFTPGTAIGLPSSREKIALLRDALQDLLNDALLQTGVDPRNDDPALLLPLSLPGETDCTLSGGTNVQGRMFNGVNLDHVCTVEADQYSGRFVHVEQQRNLRKAELYPYWIQAINNAYVQFATADPPSRITVTYPNDGTEVWGRGTSKTITWTKTGNVPNGDVKISLHLNDVDKTYLRTLGFCPVSAESCTISELSGSATEGDNFLVRVRSEVNTNFLDYSDAPFSVVNPITINKPLGGTLFQIGANMEITWSVLDFPPNEQIKLTLHKGPSYTLYKTIVTTMDNTGSYIWKVPSSVTADSTYSVRVRLESEISVLKYTNFFCIKSC